MKYVFLTIVIAVITLLGFSLLQNTRLKQSINLIKPTTEFTLGEYKNCKVYSRSSINIPPSDNTLTDKSEVRCDIAGTNKTLFEITDKPTFENAENSILQVWHDGEGYKAMVVDVNGAGSGEGNGKVILLTNPGYKLLSCFYYSYETFHEKYNEPYGTNTPLSDLELKSIKENPIADTSPYCSNFTFASYLN